SIDNAKDSAEYLLCFVLKTAKSHLYIQQDIPISQSQESEFFQLINRRSKNEPIDYIIGEKSFYNCSFLLNSNVLIPRQETEILVDFAAEVLKKENIENKILFDICSGSGCIGISLKKKFENLKVYLSDISQKAIELAKQNAKKNNVKVFFKHGDLLKPFKSLKADYVICNPPYVSIDEYDELDADVKNFEPKIALSAKDKGLEFYKKIEKRIFKYLNPKAKLFFEIGYMQKENILDVFSSEKWKNKHVYQDFSGKNRFFFVEIQ
ncbi:MAG: N5-glutamine S-adenosyl-L-methionine-dependent methyltransferase, partial [uncultured bacterium]